MESKVYFSVNGHMDQLIFKPLSTIWLKDIFEEVYEKYIYYYKEGATRPFYFETPNENSIVEHFSFSFETEKECIQTLCKYHFPKLSENGEIVEEGKHLYSSGVDFYTFDKTLYPTAVLVHLDDINVCSHKYSRDLDEDKVYDCLPPIKLKRSIDGDFLYEIRDGFHRTKYAKARGFTKIPAIIS